MGLAQFVNRFVDGPVPGGVITDRGRFIRYPPPQQYNLPIACHTATFIWLWKAKYGRNAFPAFTDIFKAQGIMNELIRLGHPTRVSPKHPPAESDVLIFASGGQADHSCVCIRGGADGLIAGHNQQHWFSGHVPAHDHAFSVHRFNQIKWTEARGPFAGARAFNNQNNAALKIWAIRGATAIAREL